VAEAHGKPVWMTLQIAWSGSTTGVKERAKATQPVAKKTLRFPTFAQERYMTYAAIINGARGINYQGGALPLSLNEQDAKLGWNWTHWKKVMRPLVEELGDKSPLNPALLAADPRLPIKVSGAKDVEFCVRQVENNLFILAAKREGDTVQVKFTGLPATESQAQVMFEEPRKVQLKDRSLEDWFGPNEVHVYKVGLAGTGG
jgi:hypothetical protein